MLEYFPTIPQVLFTIIVAILLKWIITLAIRRFSTSTKPEIHMKDWKKDVVYLYQFPRSPVLPNLSPFCLKLEAWLRAHNIKHEICETMFKRSKEGLLPFVEFNGEHIADSQIIILRLQKHFNIDDGLSDEDKGISRAVERMIEGSTFYALVYFKVVENAPNMVKREVSGLPLPEFVTNIIGKFFGEKVRQRLHGHGMGRHPRDDIITILRRDIQAVCDIIGDNKFLFGDKPSTADFTVFGHLATTYYLPYRQPITDMLDDEFPRVKELIELIRTHYFPEWKHKK